MLRTRTLSALVIGMASVVVVGPVASGAKRATKKATTAVSPAPLTPNSAATAASAAKWCAFVIDVNTRHGYMKNKRYVPAMSVNLQVQKAIAEEGIARRAQLLAVTPPEIRGAMTAELDYFVSIKANGWKPVSSGAFTPAMQQQLVAFQQQKCGIRFG